MPQSGLPSRRRFLQGSLAGVVAMAVGTGCTKVDLGEEKDGGKLLERLKDRGRVRMGFAGEIPYAYLDKDAELTGEAAEVGKEIFRRLGVDEFEPILADFGTLIPGLRAGLFDVIAAGMFITPKRCKQILFTDPDYNAPEAFLVPRGNPRKISRLEDFQGGGRVGVLLGSVESGFTESLGIPRERVVVFPDQTSGLDGVAAGRADALMLTAISLRTGLENRSGAGAQFEITDPYVPIIDGAPQYGAGGFGFLPDQQDIVDAFNRELAGMKRSGELLGIISEFGFTEAELTDLTAQQLCTGDVPLPEADLR